MYSEGGSLLFNTVFPIFLFPEGVPLRSTPQQSVSFLPVPLSAMVTCHRPWDLKQPPVQNPTGFLCSIRFLKQTWRKHVHWAHRHVCCANSQRLFVGGGAGLCWADATHLLLQLHKGPWPSPMDIKIVFSSSGKHVQALSSLNLYYLTHCSTQLYNSIYR